MMRRLKKHLGVVPVVLLVSVIGVMVFHFSRAATPFISAEAESGAATGNASKIADSTASGGSVIRFSANAANTGFLPFTMPSQTALKASDKKVFAHYFPPYPKSLDNKEASVDYYTKNYLSPSGENGKHEAYGGSLRERPLPQPVGGTNWRVDNMKIEVKQATNAGLDGFTVDILGTSGQNWDNVKYLLQGAEQADPNFKILLMPDSNGSGVAAGQESFAAAIASIADSKSVYRLPDGRLVISPFYPDNSKTGAAWWKSWLDLMKSKYNIDVAFVPCFLSFSTTNQAAFKSFSYGYSNWGNRSPTAQSNNASYIQRSHNDGKIWMQPVSMQDERPNQSLFYESYNTENLRTTWQSAAGGADWIQIPTWNDYSEGAEISPSTQIGWGPLDISSYYLQKFKFGSEPTINKDVLYLSHRTQFWQATKAPASTQTKFMAIASGSATPRDTVEVLSFLTAAAKVTIKVGSTSTTYDAPAGVFARTVPLGLGSISVTAARDNTPIASINSPFPVQPDFIQQDLQYHVMSSTRGNNGIGHYNDGL